MFNTDAAQNNLILTNYRFLSAEDISSIVDLPQSQQRIKSIMDGIYADDLVSTLQGLGLIVTSLKLAFAGSKGAKCSIPISNILCRQADLMVNMRIALGSFAENCLSILKKHKSANDVYAKNKNQLETAITLYSSCAEIANKMASECDQLINKCDAISREATNAIVKAKEDELDDTKLKDEKQIKDLMINLAIWRTSERSLYAVIGALNTDKIKLEQEIKQFNRIGLAFKMTSFFIMPLTETVGLAKPIIEKARSFQGTFIPGDNKVDAKQISKLYKKKNKDIKSLSQDMEVKKTQLEQELAKVPNKQDSALIAQLQQKLSGLEEQIKSQNEAVNKLEDNLRKAGEHYEQQAKDLRERETSIETKLAALRKEHSEIFGKLRAAAVEIKISNEQTNSVKQVAGLIVVQSAIGEVRRIIGRAKEVWKHMADKCTSQADSIKDNVLVCQSGDGEEIPQFLLESAYEFIALCKLNLIANETMKQVENQGGSPAQNLPTSATANQYIQSTPLSGPRVEEITNNSNQ